MTGWWMAGSRTRGVPIWYCPAMAGSATQEQNDRIEAVWRGSIDMHVHAAPDPIAARRHDAYDLAIACRDAGMRAIVFKSHELSLIHI